MPNEIGTCALYYDPEDAARDDGFGWNVVDPHGVVAERFKDPYDAVAALRNEVDDGTTPWDDDLTQFARLLCEVRAEVAQIDVERLLATTDLTSEQLEELFDRANRRWEAAKLRAFPAGTASGEETAPIMWKCEVIEVQHVRCTYFVEAGNELEALAKARDGITDKEFEGELESVSARHVESVVREASE